MPADYYQVPGVPYPARPNPNYRGRTAAQQFHSELVAPQEGPPDEAAIREMGQESVVGTQPNRDPAMRADAGMSAMSPRDPYMANLPPRQAPASPGTTTIQPDRRTPYSRADAQAMLALKYANMPAADAAAAIAADPISTPRKVTGSFGGKSFEMQPSAQVDRNVLARLYAQDTARQGREREDNVRGQVAKNAQDLVRIPGEQATARAQINADTELALAKAAEEAGRPLKQAEVDLITEKIAASKRGDTRLSDQDKSTKTQQMLENAKTAYDMALAAPDAKTSKGRANIRAAKLNFDAVMKQSQGDIAAQPDAEAALPEGPADVNIEDEDAIMADPEIERLQTEVEANSQGSILNSPLARWKQNNAAAQLNERIRVLATQRGVDPSRIAARIRNRVAPSLHKKSLAQNLGEGLGLDWIDQNVFGVKPRVQPAEVTGR